MSSTYQNTQSKKETQTNGSASVLGKDFRDLGEIGESLASDAAQLVQENAAQYYEKGLNQVKKFEKKIESGIQKHPVRSLLLVAGAGLVLGSLLRMRRA